uniref:Uncharacterized protein n=1 Tax=Craspedostauros australis TaxID=1486917 RepID=A0A7R9WYZ5_9STRA|mmetsp:Transcript_5277/g.14259  ORF Transcript_5277/g.14259 Transcript_5277/m.14259 type:complete len:286 (+) Transcript_5277:158-1015(+)
MTNRKKNFGAGAQTQLLQHNSQQHAATGGNMTTTFVKTKDHMGMVGCVIVDIPADVAFDVLADFSCHPRVFRLCTRMDLISTPDVGVASVKESSAPAHSLPHRVRVADDTVLEASKEGNTRGRVDRVQVGSKYRAKFSFGASSNQTYNSILTITGVDVDSESNRYEISWATTVRSCTLTTTQTVHEVQPDEKQQQQGCDANEHGSCHIADSFALVPNNWRGRLFLWFRGKQLQRDGMRTFPDDMEDLYTEVRRRMDASKEGHLNPTIGKDSTASTHLTEETDVGS